MLQGRIYLSEDNNLPAWDEPLNVSFFSFSEWKEKKPVEFMWEEGDFLHAEALISLWLDLLTNSLKSLMPKGECQKTFWN